MRISDRYKTFELRKEAEEKGKKLLRKMRNNPVRDAKELTAKPKATAMPDPEQRVQLSRPEPEFPQWVINAQERNRQYQRDRRQAQKLGMSTAEYREMKRRET